MLVDGIWPPSLVPLFLKDGGHFPTYVDADEKKRASFRDRKLPKSPPYAKRWRRASSIINAATGAANEIFSERKRSLKRINQQRSVSTTSFSESSISAAISGTALLHIDSPKIPNPPSKKFFVRFNVGFIFIKFF